MRPNFAMLEARVNTAVFAHLANATATLAGLEVDGIFDAAYALGDVGGLGMASTQPVLTLPTAQVPTYPVGLAVLVKGVAYLVAAHEPDGTGMSRLALEKA